MLCTADKTIFDQLNAKDWFGNTPLQYAAALGDSKMIRNLLTAGADPNIKNPSGKIPIANAMRSHNLDAFSILLEVTNISIRDKECYELLLHLSFYWGYVTHSKQIIARGADINSIDNNPGRSPLHIACDVDNKDTAIYLCEQGAKINQQHTLSNNSHGCLKVLLQRGADLNLTDLDSHGCLHFAALYADTKP